MLVSKQRFLQIQPYFSLLYTQLGCCKHLTFYVLGTDKDFLHLYQGFLGIWEQVL